MRHKQKYMVNLAVQVKTTLKEVGVITNEVGVQTGLKQTVYHSYI